MVIYLLIYLFHLPVWFPSKDFVRALECPSTPQSKPTVNPVTTDHSLVSAKAVFSSRWSLVRGLHRVTIMWIPLNDMYVKMQLIQFPRTCAMSLLFQVKQHLQRKTETSNSAATSEARNQTFPLEISFCAGLQICSCDQSYRLSLF